MFGNDIDFCVSSMTLSSVPGAYMLLGYCYTAVKYVIVRSFE